MFMLEEDDNMIKESEWYNKTIAETMKDPRFTAESDLLGLTEAIWQIYGKPKGVYRVFY